MLSVPADDRPHVSVLADFPLCSPWPGVTLDRPLERQKFCYPVIGAPAARRPTGTDQIAPSGRASTGSSLRFSEV
jgi:hypothetical protein